MDMTMMAQFLNEQLGLMIDVMLIAGVFCLWLIWYRNGKRQKNMEQLLMATAQQLEEATMHLSQATYAIEQLKQQEQEAPAKPFKAAEPAMRHSQSEPSPVTSNQVASAQSLPPQNSTQATMILRMQREGESEEGIADRLDIPLAQVRLMLKLHAASYAG